MTPEATVPSEERRALICITRKLRQAKRQAFLKQVQKPQDNVDQFRRLLLQLATAPPSEGSRARSPSVDSSSIASSSSSTLDSICEESDGECGEMELYSLSPKFKTFSVWTKESAGS